MFCCFVLFAEFWAVTSEPYKITSWNCTEGFSLILRLYVTYKKGNSSCLVFELLKHEKKILVGAIIIEPYGIFHEASQYSLSYGEDLSHGRRTTRTVLEFELSTLVAVRIMLSSLRCSRQWHLCIEKRLFRCLSPELRLIDDLSPLSQDHIYSYF